LNATTILLVDPEQDQADIIRETLESASFRCHVATTAKSALKALLEGGIDVVFSELSLPDMDGLALARTIVRDHPRLPVIIITGSGTTETAIEATKLGAYEYLLKPLDRGEILEVATQAARASRRMNTPVETADAEGAPRDVLLGRSRAMQEIYKELGRIAAKPVTVLIRGETGTGKELIARAIYQHGHRSHLPFISVNCAAIPETLLESELFGHEKGAFTGADSRRIGRFEQANNGTLFLDEIGDISAGIQAKLLRVLQERSLQRLGGREDIPVDVRVIAATNRDLERAIEERAFRADLFYRLNTVTISLPPLRQRREDIPILARYFTQRFSVEFETPVSIDDGAVELLVDQPWPGNVRQLQNIIRQAVLRSRGFPITRESIAEILQDIADIHASGEGYIDSLISHTLGRAASGDAEDVYADLLK
jgi:DNA-binding NtrC family response regulator